MQTITHDLTVTANPQSAYRAVATADGIKRWWAKNSDVGEVVGAKTELRFTKGDMTAVMNFEVTALEAGRRVEWTCTQNTNPIWPGSKMTWEIEAAPDGSVVHFKHDGFSGGGPPYDMTVDGWQFFMDSLQAYLSGGVAQPSD